MFEALFREANTWPGSRAPMATGSNRPEADVGKRPLPARSGHRQATAVGQEWTLAV